MTPFIKFLSVAALGGALVIGTASLAQERSPDGAPGHGKGPWSDGPMGHHHGGGFFEVFQQLDLTDAQRGSIRGILEAAKPKIQAIREDMKKNREPLREITPDDPKYGATVTQVAQNEATLVSRLIQQRAAIKADIYKQLTPDQKAKLEKIKADMGFRRALGGGTGEGHHGDHGAWGRPQETPSNP